MSKHSEFGFMDQKSKERQSLPFVSISAENFQPHKCLQTSRISHNYRTSYVFSATFFAFLNYKTIWNFPFQKNTDLSLQK